MSINQCKQKLNHVVALSHHIFHTGREPLPTRYFKYIAKLKVTFPNRYDLYLNWPLSTIQVICYCCWLLLHQFLSQKLFSIQIHRLRCLLPRKTLSQEQTAPIGVVKQKRTQNNKTHRNVQIHKLFHSCLFCNYLFQSYNNSLLTK